MFKEFLNYWYKNHGVIYKVILLIITTLFIVYLFPKTGKFKYNFEMGKPWQSENLYAPFNFAIQKTDKEIKEEKITLKNNSPLYFEVKPSVYDKAKINYQNKFNEVFIDSSLFDISKDIYYALGNETLKLMFENGIVETNFNSEPEKPVIILNKNEVVKRIKYKDLYETERISSVLDENFSQISSASDKVRLTSVFYDIIKPNLFLNEELTNQSLKEALASQSYTRGSIERDQLIISKGQVVELEEYTILSSLKAEYEAQDWNSSNYNIVMVAYTMLVALVLIMLLLFLQKYRFSVFQNNTKITFIFFNIVLMILISTLVISYNAQYIYVVPLCILPLILKAFFDARLGLFTHVLTVLLLGFIVPNSYEYMFLQIIAGIVTILTVSELYKRANLFISVGQITLIYIIAYFAFFVIHEGQITTLNWENFGLFILCGLATLFVQPLIYIYEKLFGLVSDVSLLELSDTNSKLLKELSNKAPGTFHHSLNVANLAEAAANEIGANAMLVRVGALYHDIGKMKNPTYFTENQNTGLNPHNDLSNKESAEIIINHRLNGIELAKKYNLPDRIIDFIRTHHGTSLVYFFYMKEKAENKETEVLKEDFSYPGPIPFSKETAILMMCDSVEAASKSLKEPSSTKINTFVENIINKQMESGQFLNANITFKEIQSIKKVLKHKLANIYHLRIEYPE